jgi:hypothetical protein
LQVGDQVYLDATTGGLPDGLYTVAGVTSANVYTISLTGSGTSGNANAYRFVRIRYKINTGSGYSASWQNLYYKRAGGATTSGSATITMADTTGVAVDDYIYGIGVGVDAQVQSIDSSTQITATVNSVATGTNLLLEFNHLPVETISASTGFNLKLSFTPDTPGKSLVITYLTIPTTTTATAQDNLYPLDTVPITVTVKDVVTGDPIENARVFVEATTGGSAPEGTDILAVLTNASGVATGTTQYTSQPVIGVVRRASSAYGTLYKPSPIDATIGSTGLDLTILMIPDE